MRVRLILVALSAVEITMLPACSPASSPAATTAAPSSYVQRSRVVPTNVDHNSVDVEFLRRMIPQRNRSVAMISQVGARAASQEVKELAARMDVHHEAQIGDMQQMLLAWREARPLPGAASPRGTPREGQLLQLAATAGRAFDRSFLQMMIAHHRAGMSQAGIELAGGNNYQALALAHDVVGVDQAEIEQMQALLTRI